MGEGRTMCATGLVGSASMRHVRRWQDWDRWSTVVVYLARQSQAVIVGPRASRLLHCRSRTVDKSTRWDTRYLVEWWSYNKGQGKKSSATLACQTTGMRRRLSAVHTTQIIPRNLPERANSYAHSSSYKTCQRGSRQRRYPRIDGGRR